MPTHDVKCPRCGGRAAATVRVGGVAGSYREPLVRWVARRVACSRCGFNVTSDDPSSADPSAGDLSSGGAIPCELWYKVAVRGRTAWARDRAHAAFLVDYLLDRLPAREVGRAGVETLPGWMIEPKNRVRVAGRFQRLLDEG